MGNFLPYGRQWVDETDAEAVTESLLGDWLTTGPAVSAFEDEIRRITGARRAIAVSSGTAALHAAYFAAGVGPGTEVIVPALTFSSTANVAVALGAKVRFADVDPVTWTISAGSVRALLTERTRVVTPVDYAGHPADYEAVRGVIEGTNVLLVGDASHSLGASAGGVPVGTLADLTTFSFHPVKPVTTGEGGAVTTDDDGLAQRALEFRTHGIRRGELEGDPDHGPWAYDIVELGLNYRITDFQCALGRSQLRHLSKWIERRQAIAAQYREQLAAVPNVELPPDAPGVGHGYHLFPVLVPAAKRREIFIALRERGIGVQVHYIPVNMLKYYRDRGYSPESTPVALETYRRLISLPMFPRMENQDVPRVVSVLRELVAPRGA
ncbi:MAG: aminotransferase class I/II-fold pyridoxal phosphate-dependent enzyme [Myxococcota bacterium]